MPVDGILVIRTTGRFRASGGGTGIPAQTQVIAIGGHLPAGPIVAGSALMAVATVLGGWLALRRPGRQQAWLGAAAGALLVIAGLHLLPEAWSAARAARLWPLAVPAAALASFAVAGLVARRGCSCGSGRHDVGGAGSAAALAVHRFLEGAALALTASLAVAVALAVHAMAEGLAVGALLGSRSRRRVAGWLAAMCLSPVAGAAAISAYPLPPAAEPVLLALAAGVLAQAARISLDAACRSPAGRRLAPRAAAAMLAAAAVTVMAVRVAG
jgi:zinc transporter ZupT